MLQWDDIEGLPLDYVFIEAFYMLWVCNNSVIPFGHSAVCIDCKVIVCVR